MLPTTLTDMLDALDRPSGAGPQAEPLQRFARALVDSPDLAARLLEALAGTDASGDREERMSRLLCAALDEARMARENGQRRGAVFIEALEDALARLAGNGALSGRGRLALSGSWVRAGLAPPESLAAADEPAGAPLPDNGMDDPGDIGAKFDAVFGEMIEAAEGSATAAHAMFAEMLPTLPADARQALVRTAVARPGEIFAHLGCAWLLDPDAAVRGAAVQGLADRLAADRLTAATLARLSIMRSWLTEEALTGRLDDLLRAAMRAGIAPPAPDRAPTLHRIVASMVDGTGAQSLAASVRSGGARRVAVVLLKQGFGVKDAYVIDCDSATEQRKLMATITDEIEARDVGCAYMAEAIGLALGEGLAAGTAPAPGLVDVARACGLTALRPGSATVADILTLADPEDRIAGLSVQARGRLINASRAWPERHAMLASWFEDSDATAEALETATSRTALKRGLWQVLEARRDHWARLIARNAHLLRAAGEPGADEFVAVAGALSEGRALKKTPVMEFVFEQSLYVWAEQQHAPETISGDPDPALPFGETAPAPADAVPLGDIRAETPGELARLLEPAGLTAPWLDGYLAAVCTAPRFVPPGEWVGPLLHLAAEALETEAKMQRFLDLVMLRYNTTVLRLRAGEAAHLIPRDPPLLAIWADGYLTAWEATKSFWPARALGQQGKRIRKLLEAATDGRIDRQAFSDILPAWLIRQFAAQSA